jgi:hypothetical protein
MFNLFKKKPIKKVEEMEITKDNISIFFNKFYKPRVPLLIKGGANNWPLIKKWNTTYISEIAGTQACTIVEDSRPAFAKEQTTLRFFFNNLIHKGTLTLTNYDNKNLPKFLKDIPLPNLLFSKKDIYRYFFYFGPDKSGTLPHNHGDAFNILSSGTKEWLFYDANKAEAPKGQKEMLKTLREYHIGSNASDYFKKEISSLNKRIDDVSMCTQEAGDIIYVPRQYSHAVLNKSDVMGIAFETKILK